MTAYPNMTREERGAEYTRVRQEFELWKAKGLKLNMARGKPGKQQLDLVSDIFSLMQDPQDYVSDGIDVRNYGELSGPARLPSGSLPRFSAVGQGRCLWAAMPACS